MSADYLHGSETVIVNTGSQQVRVIKTSVIGLVGIAPKGAQQAMKLITSTKEAAQFGEEVPGFSIPQALASIFAQGPATVIVINVLNDEDHLDQTTAEAHVVTSGKAKTTDYPVGSPIVKDTGGSTTYVEGTDYTIDQFGNLKIIAGGGISEGDTIKIDYLTLNGGNVTSADIIGGYDDGTDTYTGLQLFDLAFNTFGFNPKILIAPQYSTVTDVVTEMIVKSEKFRAHSLIDAPTGTLIADAITGRGPSGSINFYTDSKWVVPCFPWLMAYDKATDADEARPYSQFLAGVMANVDLNEGYHVSPSNHSIKGIVGLETPITWQINDANSNANKLNEVGIVTIASGFGTGFRVWGNRSASFPSSSLASNFICVQRVAAIVDESVELAMLAYVDQPITNALIDNVLQSVNKFLRSLIQRGAIIDGACTYDPTKNSAEDLAAGKVQFDNTFMPPTPAERITFNSFIDTSLLKAIGTTA